MAPIRVGDKANTKGRCLATEKEFDSANLIDKEVKCDSCKHIFKLKSGDELHKVSRWSYTGFYEGTDLAIYCPNCKINFSVWRFS